MTPDPTAEELTRLRWNQCSVAVLTFWTYGSAHVARQSFAALKPSIQDTWGFNQSFLGYLDTGFLLCYAFGLYVSGSLGDRFPANQVLFAGLFSAAILIAVFSLAVPVLGIPEDKHWFFLILWSLNGACQSVGWPTSLKLMANWWTSEGGGHAGLVFGIWAACQMLGNIVGSEMVSVLHSLNVSVHTSLLIGAVNLALPALVLFLTVYAHPNDIGLSLKMLQVSESEESDASSVRLNDLDVIPDATVASIYGATAANSANVQESEPDQHSNGNGGLTELLLTDDDNQPQSPTVNSKAVTITGALMIPGCIQYCLCFAAVKGVNYSLYFWLVYYLENTGFSENAANKMETIYNASQILGGWIIGWMSDDIFLHFRSVPVFFALAGSTVPIFLLRVPSHSQVYVALLSLLAGFTIGGANNTVSSVVASDLGSHPTLGRNAAAMATVSGLIDGSGSLGAALCQLVIALLHSWDSVFIVLSALLCFACIILIRVVSADFQAWMRMKRASPK